MRFLKSNCKQNYTVCTFVIVNLNSFFGIDFANELSFVFQFEIVCQHRFFFNTNHGFARFISYIHSYDEHDLCKAKRLFYWFYSLCICSNDLGLCVAESVAVTPLRTFFRKMVFMQKSSGAFRRSHFLRIQCIKWTY